MRMTFRTIVIGGALVFTAVVLAVVFAPMWITYPDQTVIAHAYTADQSQGRELFYSNGCNYCHTQYVREEDTAMGLPSEAGNYVFDEPVILGSERSGPDLSYIGRKRSETWEIEHLKDPRAYSPMSIMPSYDFLSDVELLRIAEYLYALGDRVAGEQMIRPPDAYAYEQDTISYAMVDPLGDQSQGWDDWSACGLQEGKELYVDRCLTCHGCSGNGLGSYGGTLSVTPANFKQEPYSSMPEDEFYWHVSEGVPGTVMPPWKQSLTEDQRWSVVRYVTSIFARPTMHDPDEGDPSGTYADLTNPLPLDVSVLDQAKSIFIRECMVCHGASGRGDGQYRQEIQPGPPDFGVLADYADYSDADYFWRISEGVPWSAMPSWKLRYSEEDRWALVHYLRTIFTQTETSPTAPTEGNDFSYPDFYRDSMRFPETVSASRGQIVFMENCAACHGLAGDGQGESGQYLNPTPADFRQMAGVTLEPESQGEFMAMVTFGIQDTAMPAWGEWLREDQRWDAIKYVMEAFIIGWPEAVSSYGGGQVPSNFATVSSDVFVSEGHVISVTQGADIYATYCMACHAEGGQGSGEATVGGASGGPAEFPQDMNEQYVFWRTWEGVPDSIMYPFKWVLTSEDAWDVTTYIEGFATSSAGTN